MNLALRKGAEHSAKALKIQNGSWPGPVASLNKPGFANPENRDSGFAHLQVLGGILRALSGKWPLTSAFFHLPRVLQDQLGFQAQLDQRARG